jgi:hypothetical protein
MLNIALLLVAQALYEGDPGAAQPLPAHGLATQPAAGAKASGVVAVEAVKKVAAALIAVKDNELALMKARAEFAEAALAQAKLQADMSAATKLLPDWCEGGQLRTDFTFLCPPKLSAPKAEAKK